MTVSAVSHYRGGTIDVVTSLAKTLKAVYLTHGVAYRLSRFELIAGLAGLDAGEVGLKRIDHGMRQRPVRLSSVR
jgi:hypothetical protein